MKKQTVKSFLNKEDLLKKEVLEIVEVDLGEGVTTFVRQMTGRERDKFEGLLVNKIKKGKTIDFEQNLDDFRAKLAVNTLCNKEGVLLLEPKDFEQLSKNMSAFRLEKIVNVAQKINKISEEDKEELVKN